MNLHVIQVMHIIPTWEALKDYVKEHARIVAVHMTKQVF